MQRQKQRQGRGRKQSQGYTPGGIWGRLIRERREKAIYRITLTVRGRVIVKDYATEDEYRRWRRAFEEQMHFPDSGVEAVRGGIVYR